MKGTIKLSWCAPWNPKCVSYSVTDIPSDARRQSRALTQGTQNSVMKDELTTLYFSGGSWACREQSSWQTLSPLLLNCRQHSKLLTKFNNYPNSLARFVLCPSLAVNHSNYSCCKTHQPPTESTHQGPETSNSENAISSAPLMENMVVLHQWVSGYICSIFWDMSPLVSSLTSLVKVKCYCQRLYWTHFDKQMIEQTLNHIRRQTRFF